MDSFIEIRQVLLVWQVSWKLDRSVESAKKKRHRIPSDIHVHDHSRTTVNFNFLERQAILNHRKRVFLLSFRCPFLTSRSIHWLCACTMCSSERLEYLSADAAPIRVVALAHCVAFETEPVFSGATFCFFAAASITFPADTTKRGAMRQTKSHQRHKMRDKSRIWQVCRGAKWNADTMSRELLFRWRWRSIQSFQLRNIPHNSPKCADDGCNNCPQRSTSRKTSDNKPNTHWTLGEEVRKRACVSL